MDAIEKLVLFTLLLVLVNTAGLYGQWKQVPFAELEEKLDNRLVKCYYYQGNPFEGLAILDDQEYGFT